MRRVLLIFSAAALLLVVVRAAEQRTQETLAQQLGIQQQQQEETEEVELKQVDFDARFMSAVPGMPDSVMRLVGDVVLHHNGAVVVCDSAYRFGDNRFECYGRVMINKDSTYIYGDRAVYDGLANTAQVFSPMVKVISGNTVLYTHNFIFNTLDNEGRYWGRGTIEQNGMRLESQRGYYFSDLREFICVGEVEATNDEYMMRSDSVRYNMDTEITDFYTYTTIWNEGGEIARATRGRYHNREGRYEFTSNSYILTATQEVWSDSLDYDSRLENAVLRNNVQIRDEEQMMLAFGDYGEYWGATEDALLTRRPSLISFDPEQDSLFMRADSIFMYSLAYELDFREHDSLRRLPPALVSPDSEEGVSDETPPALPMPVMDEDAERGGRDEGWLGDVSHDEADAMREAMRWMLVDRMREFFVGSDTLTSEQMRLRPGLVDTLLQDGVSSEQIEALMLYNERRLALEAEGRTVATDSLIYRVLETVGAFGNMPVPSEDEQAREALRALESSEDGEEIRGADEREATAHVGQGVTTERRGFFGRIFGRLFGGRRAETVATQPVTSMPAPAPIEPEVSDLDSFDAENIDYETLDRFIAQLSEGADAAAEEPAPEEPEPPKQDSLQRVVRAFRDVRIYRHDMQAVADSLMAFSKDSTVHLYIDPVMWNQQNQITAERIELLARNEELYRSRYFGWPMMVSEVSATQYNQIKGREMESRFRDNEVFWHFVEGSAEMLYYMMDEEADAPNGFFVSTSASIAFFIENRTIGRISSYQTVDGAGYPLDGIPDNVPRFLDGFRWEIERKPTQADVFDREIRPSEREHYEGLPQPQFPITEAIDRERRRLVMTNMWEDRTDTLPLHALRFLEYLERRDNVHIR
ncbi:MAG: hypothetical protein FWE10_00070 [Rikenellaceae bacterium]|nr:hypothetical protein [Rikenellaceae bacterium]MCL2692137.1 hypothetical protein [Rikenellaceae bacterium]